MANPDRFSNTSKPYQLRTSTWTVSQSISANRSQLRTQVWVDRLSTQYAFSSGQADRSLRVGGVVVDSINGSGFDFSGDGPWLILDHTYSVDHDADGTLTIQIRSDAVYDILGSALTTMNYTPATIPRASTATFVGGSSLGTGNTYTINTNRASTSFTHDITYSFQGQSGTIATGVGASTTWTPNASLFNIPALDDKTSASGSITTVTKSGSTTIGSKVTAFTLTLANDATGRPTWTSVVSSEGTSSPDVATLVGKYVQGISKITGTFNGLVGAQGSTITSKKFTVAGQAVNVSGTSATTPSPINASGTVGVAFEATDTRGRKQTGTVNIDVLTYTTPSATDINAYRAGASGSTADPQGTRLEVTLDASVHSLMNSTEKNRLTVKVYSSPSGANTWTLRSTPVNASTTLSQSVAVGFGSVGDFPVASAFDVKVEVEDIFTGTTRATYIGTVTTGTIFQHWSTGMGVGKFWTDGMLDVAGDVYVKAGNSMNGDLHVEGRVVASHGPYAMAAGTVSINTAGSTTGSATVTFPVGRFTQTPIVNVTGTYTQPSGRTVSVSGVSSTGCTVYWYNGGATATVPIQWTAIQMTSASGAG
jgi:hypothetical protein